MAKLVVFAGPPCTGKSTVAGLLGFAHIEMDAVRARILPGASHTREDRAVAYRAALMMAEALLPRAEVVIVDGGFGREEDRAQYRRVAFETSSELFVVEFAAPLDIVLARNRARRAHHPGLDLDDARVTEIVTTYPWLRTGLTIDATQPAEACARAVRLYIGEDA